MKLSNRKKSSNGALPVRSGLGLPSEVKTIINVKKSAEKGENRNKYPLFQKTDDNEHKAPKIRSEINVHLQKFPHEY